MRKKYVPSCVCLNICILFFRWFIFVGGLSPTIEENALKLDLVTMEWSRMEPFPPPALAHPTVVPYQRLFNQPDRKLK